MALEDEPPGHNRLKRMRLPGFGNTPDSPRDIRPQQDYIPAFFNDNGINLEEPNFQEQYLSTLGMPSQNVQQNLRPKESSRTIYALLAASAIAIGSLLANYVQLEQSVEDVHNRNALRQRLGEALQENDDRQIENDELRRRQKKLVFENKILEADVTRFQTELMRMREAHQNTVLEMQRPLPENGDRVSDNTNNGRRVSSRKSTGIDD